VDVVALCADHEEAAALLPAANPDVVLVDGTAGDSLTAVEAIAAAVPMARTVTLALPEVEELVLAHAEAGVSGYVGSDSSADELVSALGSAVRGEMLCSPRIAGSLLRRVADVARERAPSAALARLTRREQEIVRLIDEGLSNKQIAQRLSIELATVKNHVHNILEKLGVARRAEAAAAIRNGKI
jgi:two-component system nitrate/nitrite response regulator NarL